MKTRQRAAPYCSVSPQAAGVTAGRFTDKVIAITGATAGIGTATARRFAAEGGTLILTGRNVRSAEALLDELGERAVFVAGDVRERATADRVVAAALEGHGKLDVLVNNAAVDHTGDVLDTPIEEVRALFDVNVFGAHAHAPGGRPRDARAAAARSSTSPRGSPRSGCRRWRCTAPPRARCSA